MVTLKIRLIKKLHKYLETHVVFIVLEKAYDFPHLLWEVLFPHHAYGKQCTMLHSKCNTTTIRERAGDEIAYGISVRMILCIEIADRRF